MPGQSRRRPATPAARDQADKTRAAKLAALHQTLTDQVTALAAGEQWQRWLTVAARFHAYSLNNTLLLLAQNPNATRVAGYTLWQQLGRQVRRGEKGLAILAPVTRRTDPPDDARADGQHAGAPNETTAESAGPRRVVGYRPVYVWDITQTDGPPLPEPPAPQLLTGQAPPGLWDSLAAQCTAAGYTVTREPIVAENGPNGYTDFTTRRVVVRTRVDDAQAVKTLAHELGHVLLHELGAWVRNAYRPNEGTTCRVTLASERNMSRSGCRFTNTDPRS